MGRRAGLTKEEAKVAVAASSRRSRPELGVTVELRNRIEEGRSLVNQYTLAPGVGIVTLGTLLETDGRRIPQAHLELVRFSKP